MGKIICDICGTVYSDNAESCPICGYTHSGTPTRNRDLYSEDLPSADITEAEAFVPEQAPKPKHIFDFDEVNPDDDDDGANAFDDNEPMQPYEEPPRHNTFLVILLVIIITLLLVAIGFLFFRFYLPSRASDDPEAQPVQTEAVVPSESEETTEPKIPCTSLALTSGVTQLSKAGQYWLLHVTVQPEDTTDELIYTSADASVATVSEQGRITAVGEGETYIYITCGDREIKCRVVVAFEEEETTAEEVETAPEAVEYEDIPEQTTEATEETKPVKEVVLKLKKKDVSSDVRGVSFDLELDCDLTPEEVTWLTLDSSVAIVKDGVVTTIGPGQTKIVAQYQGQQVECIVRCTFS